MPRDVVTNQIAREEGPPGDHPPRSDDSVGEPTVTARRIAAAVITSRSRRSWRRRLDQQRRHQNLTSDRARLLRTLDESDLGTDISDEAKEIEAAVFALTGRSWSTSTTADVCAASVCSTRSLEWRTPSKARQVGAK